MTKNGIKLATENGTPSGLLEQDSPARRSMTSPARQRLKDLQDQRADHQRRISEARSSYNRLNDIINVAVASKKALAEFDAKSAEEMATWAKTHLKKVPPSVDGAARQKLLVEHSTAQENASAAYAARAQYEQTIAAEGQAIAALDIPMQKEIAAILIEEASGPQMDQLRDAVAAAVRLQVRLQASFQAIVDIAHSGPPDAMKPVFTMMEAFSETLRLAAAPPAPDGTGDRLAWAKFAAALRTDPASQLEDQTC
jgi:hypothetical protein